MILAIRITKWLLVALLLPVSTTACSSQALRADKPHHTANGFTNPWEKDNHSFWDLMKWRWDRMFKDIPDAEDYHFELVRTEHEFVKQNQTQTAATWIGHATILFQLEGKNILTDPQFSRRASPLQWIGPERAVAPAMNVRDLPPIHYVIISHDHYDSLDTDSIVALFERPEGKDITFIVPLRLKEWFQDLGISRVIELDWWESHIEGAISFTAVPTQHWSKRWAFSRNTTLWAGWVVRSESFNFYFCGDSGYYAPLFQEVGHKLGPFDLAAIPIGAYAPRWFMKNKHINPEEAVKVHIDLKASKSLAIHWGTFILTDEPLTEPPEKLSQALDKHKIAKDRFVVVKHGETLRF